MIWHPFTPQQGADDPLKIVRGEKEFLYDAAGREYIDAIASWWTVIHGHNHPHIMAAIQNQLLDLDHVLLAGFTHDPAEKLAAELLRLSGDHFSQVVYSDNGSTAVEIMLKLALQYWQNLGETERKTFIKFDVSYHGDTVGAMSVGGDSVFNRIFSSLLFESQSFPYPTAGASAEVVLTELEIYLQQNSDHVVAIVLEPLIAAAGGMVFQAPETLARVGQLAGEYGVLLLCDEVFTGLGRTGAMFAFEKAGIHPDMIALAKGLTGGSLPLAVTLASEKIHSAFVSDDPAKTFYHGHTMSGNPIGCAAALASLELFEKEHSLAAVAELEKKMVAHWQKLSYAFPEKIANPRVMGAASAADLVSQSEQPGYVFSAAKEIRRQALAEGVILRPLGSVIYVTPPYNISDAALDRIFTAIRSALVKYEP